MLKYEKIADDIRRSIEDGTLEPNEKLPTVVELCELYGVSKITVKRAMETLTEQGLVTSKRGSGTYVKSTSTLPEDLLYQGKADRASGFTKEHADTPGEVSSVVYDFSIIQPPAEIARRLALGPDDFTYHHCRTRLLDGVPIVIEYTYMSLDLIPGLKRTNLYGSVYSYIQDTLGLKISSFHRVIRAVRATAEEAERLDIAENDPLLELEQIGFLDDGTPFEYSKSRNVGDRYELHDINIA